MKIPAFKEKYGKPERSLFNIERKNFLEFFNVSLRHFVRLSNMAARLCCRFSSSVRKVHILQRFTYCTRTPERNKFDTSLLDILVCPLSKKPLRCAKLYQIYNRNLQYKHKAPKNQI